MHEPRMEWEFIQKTINFINLTHERTYAIADRHSEAELCKSFGPTVPPMGWHVWHIARWADRLQASLPNGPEPANPDNGIWQKKNLATAWQLDPASLGVFETGASMDLEDAIRLPQSIGKHALVSYVKSVVDIATHQLQELTMDTLQIVRPCITDFRVEGDGLVVVPNKQGPVMPDLTYHNTHISRHLGMIEALRGLFNIRGTASV